MKPCEYEEQEVLKFLCKLAKNTFLSIWSNLFHTKNDVSDLRTLCIGTFNLIGITYMTIPIKSRNFDLKV